MFAPGVPGQHFMQAASVVVVVETAAMRWIETTGVGRPRPRLHILNGPE